MGIFLGRERRSNNGHFFPEPVIPPFLGADPTGRVSVASNPTQALTTPTVWACVGLLANTVSSLTLQAYRTAPDATMAPLKMENPPQLIASPSAGLTTSEWLHQVMVSLLLRGNAYGRKTFNDAGRTIQIDLFNPDAVDAKQADDGSMKYHVGPKKVEIPASQMWHVRGMTMPGSMIGMSPIAYAAATIGVELSSRKFASDFFGEGGIPKAVITTDMKMNQEQSRTVKERLVAASRGREPVVLSDGVKYQMISVSPEESQFLATQQANVAQIARFFWIPPEMVGGSGGSSMTYANVEQRSLDFLTYGVAFWLKRIEDALFPELPSPQYVKFRVEDLLRTDAETRAKIAVQHLAGKITTPTEERAAIGLPPMTEAQQKEADMVPLTITPLGGAKALPGIKTPPGPASGDPADDPQGVQSV